MNRDEYLALVNRSIDQIGLKRHFGKNGAVILERVAYGAGMTNWSFCKDVEGLEPLVKGFSPGSVVSFYLDDRIRRGFYSPQLDEEIQSYIARDGDCVIGFLENDGRSICIEFPGGISDVHKFVAEFDSCTPFFWGAYPGRDNDGEFAFTMTVPDADGAVRGHPH
jgi:hypothetical protein